MAKKNEMATTDGNEQSVTLQDFCSIDKLDAFCDYYTPADFEGEGAEVFTDAKLREFFKAVPCGLGDPLSIYLADLRQRGYKMRVSIMGEPAIFVTRRYC